jgi:hypothetical protein
MSAALAKLDHAVKAITLRLPDGSRAHALLDDCLSLATVGIKRGHNFAHDGRYLLLGNSKSFQECDQRSAIFFEQIQSKRMTFD